MIKFRKLPDRQELLDNFDYEPLTGILRWKQSTYGRKRKANLIGQPTGCDDGKGYLVVNYKNIVWLIHRLVYFMHTGEDISEHEIDHRDLNRSNNIFTNLRKAEREQNAANSPRHKDNTSGYKGVHYCNTRKCWYGSVMHEGKLRRTLGCPTREVANELLCEMRETLHKDFCRHV